MGECLIIRGGGGTDTSDATATSSTILSGYTAYVNDSKVTGSMTNRGAVSSTLAPGGSYTIASGYHNGKGKITAGALSGYTEATLDSASYMLTGYSAWANGTLYDGSMVGQGTKNYSLSTNGSQTIPAGWHSGEGKVSQSGLSVVWGGTWTPTTATVTLVPTGWYNAGSNYVVAGNGNLASGNIKNGVSIFGVTGNFTGWVEGAPLYIIQNGVPTSALKTVVDNYYSSSGVGSFAYHWDSGGFWYSSGHIYSINGIKTPSIWAYLSTGFAYNKYMLAIDYNVYYTSYGASGTQWIGLWYYTYVGSYTPSTGSTGSWCVCTDYSDDYGTWYLWQSINTWVTATIGFNGTYHIYKDSKVYSNTTCNGWICINMPRVHQYGATKDMNAWAYVCVQNMWLYNM